MKRSTRRHGSKGAIVAGVALGLGGAIWAAKRWQQLKQTPPVSPHSHHAGLAGFYQQVGPWRMFTRITPETKTGLPVVLVHGLVLSGRSMEDLALALARDYSVLVPDLPGFGASALPNSAPLLNVEQLADALWMWLQQNNLTRAIWVANSFGCQILAALAVRQPQAVAGLVLQGPTVDRYARSLPRQIWRDWCNGRQEKLRSPGSISRIDYAKAGLWRACGTMRIMMNDAIERRLPHISAPTLILHGSRDVVSPARWVEELASLLPRGELITLANGTHTLNYVYPWSFCRAIRPFLERIQQENAHE
ncbi:alpha/beta fold hydrolase [[Erwinia] mediterraneensis]|uniref:alpha/beta fold hydrolase n=1 Tax=[Erwinia] mediterraneensis TaxID=2161819 RepID=UPI00103124A4|nr:alpha/beta hydrolase [[Erwinia] mediterraneensis]